MKHVLSGLAALVAAGSIGAWAALADSTPIGPLPKGPVSTLASTKGALVAVALPKLKTLDWRIARTVDSRIVREVGEGEIGSNVVVVFTAVGRGRATVVFAATRGDSGAKAFKAVTYRITVT